MKVLLKRFHLNGNTIGFRPQTSKLKPPHKTTSFTLALKAGVQNQAYFSIICYTADKNSSFKDKQEFCAIFTDRLKVLLTTCYYYVFFSDADGKATEMEK